MSVETAIYWWNSKKDELTPIGSELQRSLYKVHGTCSVYNNRCPITICYSFHFVYKINIFGESVDAMCSAKLFCQLDSFCE